MAGDKEILNKIRSVKNMQKITSAMEMVAASKISKAKKQMNASRPYAERIRKVIGHLGAANPDYKHPFLEERETKRVGIIVISTDKGLCGGLNVNLFKRVIAEMSAYQENKIDVEHFDPDLLLQYCLALGVQPESLKSIIKKIERM